MFPFIECTVIFMPSALQDFDDHFTQAQLTLSERENGRH